MRHILFLFLLFFFNYSQGQISNKYSIIKEKVIIKSDNIGSVISFFPIICSNYPDSSLNKLNYCLQHYNNMEMYKENCSNYFISKTIYPKIVGDCNILFESDSLIAIEYSIKMNDSIPTIYYSGVFIDLKIMELKTPTTILPIIDKSILYPYVKKYKERNHIDRINMRAYERETCNSYSIHYLRTKKHLVLYIGNEGELGGYYKIFIPIDKIKFAPSLTTLPNNDCYPLPY